MDNNFLGWISNYEDRCANAYIEISKNPEQYKKILEKYELTEADIPKPQITFAF